MQFEDPSTPHLFPFKPFADSVAKWTDSMTHFADGMEILPAPPHPTSLIPLIGVTHPFAMPATSQPSIRRRRERRFITVVRTGGIPVYSPHPRHDHSEDGVESAANALTDGVPHPALRQRAVFQLCSVEGTVAQKTELAHLAGMNHRRPADARAGVQAGEGFRCILR